jgi:RHS repeat-associated protein
MFTGRRFDIETGLYYYRARYYNPHIGRFMQTDPVGYDNGTNWYAYRGNNPPGRDDAINSYAYCVNNPPGRVDLCGLSLGDAQFERGGVTWRRPVKAFDLIFWYFWGEGQTVTYTGQVAAKIVLDDIYVQDRARNFLKETVTLARYSKETEGIINTRFEVQIDPGSIWDLFKGKITPERLLSGGTMYVSGSWIKDSDTSTVTITAEYTFYDRADFHPWIPWVRPEGHSTDTAGWLLEKWWDHVLLLGLHNYCAGKNAQPYDIYIELGSITTILRWGGSVSFVEEGWPYPHLKAE